MVKTYIVFYIASHGDFPVHNEIVADKKRVLDSGAISFYLDETLVLTVPKGSVITEKA